MKTCKDCKQSFPESEFYASPQTRDGLYGSCKGCFKLYRTKSYHAERARQVEHESALYIARHRAKREYEQACEDELLRFEGRLRVEPLSFAGVVDGYFRSRSQSRTWKAI